MLKHSFRILSIIFLASGFINFISAQTPQPVYSRNRTFDVQHYIIRVSFDRKNKIVFGDTTVQLKPLNANFKSIELDAANLKFESITLESQNKLLEYKTAGEKVFVSLDKTYSAEDLISVRFKYSAKPKKGIYFVDAEVENGKISRDAQIWTQGESEEAHFWFPSYDFPDDKATSEQFITVERDETAIGNGKLLETIANADRTKTFHFKMSTVHSAYLTSFVVGKYKKISDSFKNVPLDYYVYSNETTSIGLVALPDKTTVPSAFVNTKDMMRVFEQVTGIDYPFNKYDQTIVANFELAGMENITATTLSDKEIFLADSGFAREFVIDLVAHELAHSWFGNLVTCKNWSELWLNEGFATYMEAAYREKIYGHQEYLRKIKKDAENFRVSDAVSKNRRGLFFQAARPDNALFNVNNAAITYNKGSAVIHTLRETVGAENFWKAVNIYLNRHKFQNVDSKDLQQAMEEVSKMDLNWFFLQWIYGAGYPKLQVKKNYNPQTQILDLTILQTQKTEDNVPAEFRLPLSVEITTPNGKISRNIEIAKREETFSLKIEDKPTRIILDKEEKIPLKSVKYLSD